MRELHENVGSFIIIAISFCFPLAIVGTVLRFVSRYLQRKAISPSDWVLLISLAFAIALAALGYELVDHGLGRHFRTLHQDDKTEFAKIFVASEIVYALTISLVKLAILLFYCEIFPGRRFRFVATGLGLGVLAWTLACIITIGTCDTVRAYWEKSDSQCTDTFTYFLATAISNIVTDVCMLVLPCYNVWKLHLATRQKLLVAGMFLLGGLVIVASILRVIFMHGQNSKDPTWGLVNICNWSIIEVNIAILSASLPTLRPVVSRLWGLTEEEERRRTPSYTISGRAGGSRSMLRRSQANESSDHDTLPTRVPSYPSISCDSDEERGIIVQSAIQIAYSDIQLDPQRGVVGDGPTRLTHGIT